jgi:hypothetical protein
MDSLTVDPMNPSPMQGNPVPSTGSGVRCPACQGEMIPRRGAWSCSRCGMPLCIGCEAEVAFPEQQA